MSIPLAEERRYNCTTVAVGLKRSRPSLRADEPQEGTCILWRVLGFGGRPNPLLYSRAASFAARTAQALLGLPEPSFQIKGVARSRLQLYVDDPVLAAAGTKKQIDTAFDLALLWCMCLGVPLAWSKGKEQPSSEP